VPTRSSSDPPRPHCAPREHSSCVAGGGACAAGRAHAAHWRAHPTCRE
jgi:hypothetical protein